MTLTHAPVLDTPRLTLRGPEPRDIEPMIAFLLDRDRAAGFGASSDRGDAWRWFARYEGRGIAFEAATRARRHAYGDLGLTTLTSNIVPGNTRSIALAERLGAWFEREYDNIHMGRDFLYRHPGPDALDADDDGSVEAYA